MVRRERDRGGAASVHARLLHGAHERGEELQRVLTRYAIERFLYRLSRSPHENDFVLKGATLFAVWSDTPDGLEFDVASIVVTPIREDAHYQGLRTKMTVHLGVV